MEPTVILIKAGISLCTTLQSQILQKRLRDPNSVSYDPAWEIHANFKAEYCSVESLP